MKSIFNQFNLMLINKPWTLFVLCITWSILCRGSIAYAAGYWDFPYEQWAAEQSWTGEPDRIQKARTAAENAKMWEAGKKHVEDYIKMKQNFEEVTKLPAYPYLMHEQGWINSPSLATESVTATPPISESVTTTPSTVNSESVTATVTQPSVSKRRIKWFIDFQEFVTHHKKFTTNAGQPDDLHIYINNVYDKLVTEFNDELSKGKKVDFNELRKICLKTIMSSDNNYWIPSSRETFKDADSGINLLLYNYANNYIVANNNNKNIFSTLAVISSIIAYNVVNHPADNHLNDRIIKDVNDNDNFALMLKMFNEAYLNSNG